MPHTHWVARQNKLETPKEKDEVNKREIRECDGRARDPDTMVSPLTPKPTRKTESLARAPPTIASRREEDAALKEVALPRYRCANCILETKTKVGSTAAKAPAPRTNPNIDEATTAPKPPTHQSHPQTPRPSTPSSSLGLHPLPFCRRLLKRKIRIERKRKKQM